MKCRRALGHSISISLEGIQIKTKFIRWRHLMSDRHLSFSKKWACSLSGEALFKYPKLSVYLPSINSSKAMFLCPKCMVGALRVMRPTFT